jgi:hypothetical protein
MGTRGNQADRRGKGDDREGKKGASMVGREIGSGWEANVVLLDGEMEPAGRGNAAGGKGKWSWGGGEMEPAGRRNGYGRVRPLTAESRGGGNRGAGVISRHLVSLLGYIPGKAAELAQLKLFGITCVLCAQALHDQTIL